MEKKNTFNCKAELSLTGNLMVHQVYISPNSILCFYCNMCCRNICFPAKMKEYLFTFLNGTLALPSTVSVRNKKVGD